MSRLLALLPLLLLLPAAGCSLLRGDTPLRTASEVTVNIPAVKDGGPIAAMPVGGGSAAESIAIIDVDGVLLNMNEAGLYSLGENPVATFREKLEFAARNDSVIGVVLRINTYGGSVTASDVMWRDLEEFKYRTGKPVVACLMDVAAGGGYYIACGADQIVAHPTTVTGGIGVILNLYNLKDAMQAFSVSEKFVRAGENVDLGGPTHPHTEEQLAVLQRMANEFHHRFQSLVRRSRPRLEPAAGAIVFDGRAFTATQAEGLGLIDTIGYLDDAIAIAGQMSGCRSARVVILHRCNDRARTAYAITPNAPLQGSIVPLNLPGFDRPQMPAFLYMWQPETMLAKGGGR